MYLRIMLHINPDNETNFNLLMKFLRTDDFRRMDRLEKYANFMDLRQFCSNKLNRGEYIYKERLFESYKLMLEMDSYKKDKYIVSSVFENIVHAALRLNMFEWADFFIMKYKQDLPPEEADNTLLYSNAVICYYKREYGDALQNLSVLKKNPLPYENLRQRTLYLKIYYEVNDIESIISSTETLKKYLKNESSISQDLNIRHKNFIDLFIKLYEVRENSDGYKLKLFLQELDNTNPVADKLWFYEKYNELQK